MVQKPSAKKAAAAFADDRLSAPAADTETQKAPDVEVKEVPKPESALMAASIADKISSGSEKQAADNPQIQPSSKDKAKITVVEEKPAVKEKPAAPAGDNLQSTVIEAKTEKATEVEIEKTPKSETDAGVAAVSEKASSALEKENLATPESKQADEPKVQENIKATKPVVEPEPAPEAKKGGVPESEDRKPEIATGISATSGKGIETAVTPSVGASSVSAEVSSTTEKEAPSADAVKETSTEPGTKPALVASKGKILEKEDPAKHLRTFLNTYCQTYESKNLEKFFTFFAPDASENNRPFHELMPRYRKNMEMIDSFKYRIEILAYSTQADTGNVRIQGKFFTRYLLHGGSWQNNSGDISMELVAHGDSFLVQQLSYGE